MKLADLSLTMNWKNQRGREVIGLYEEPAYIKLYTQDLLYLSDIPKSYEKVLIELLKRVVYASEGLEITLSAGTKRTICKTLGLENIRTINNALSGLVKGKVLFHKDTGVYALNPYFFGKGDWQDICKLRLEIDYSEIEGRTFKTVCEYREEV